MNAKVFPVIGVFLLMMFIGGMGIYELAGGDFKAEIVGGVIDYNNLPSGMGILSISDVTFKSNDPLLNGDAFSMSVIQNGMSESASGTMEGTKFVDADGNKGTVPFTITSTINDYKCVYNAIALDDYTYKYQAKFMCNHGLLVGDRCSTKYGGATDAILKRECTFIANKYGDGWNYVIETQEGWLKNPAVYCVYRVKEGTIGGIKEPSFDMDSTFNIDIGTESYSLDLGVDKDVAITPNKDVRIYYQGSIATYTDCPVLKTEQFVNVINIEDYWILVDNNKLASYQNTQQLDIEACLDRAQSQVLNDMSLCINANNERTDTVSVPVDKEDIKVKGSNIYYYPDSILRPPMYSVLIKAETLNIVKNTGLPEILEVQIYDRMAGTDGKINVIVTNKGGATVSFGVSATCDNDVTIKSGAYKTDNALAYNELGLVNIGFKTPPNIDTSKLKTTCTVTAYDLTDATIKDTMTAEFNLLQRVTCVEDSIRCEGVEAEICTGISWEPSPENDHLCETKGCEIEGAIKCEHEIKYVCTDGAWTPDYLNDYCEDREDVETTQCLVNDDCDDDNIWTADICQQTAVQKLLGQKGICEHTNMLPFVIIGFIFVLIVGGIGSVIVLRMFKG